MKWFGIHWCLHNKDTITWTLGDTKFLFSCWKKYFTHQRYSTLAKEFRISVQPCNILYKKCYYYHYYFYYYYCCHHHYYYYYFKWKMKWCGELVQGTSIRQLVNNNFIIPHLNIIIFKQQLPIKNFGAVFRQSIMSRFEAHLKLQLKQKERQQMLNKTQIWVQSKLLFNIIFSISDIAHSTFHLLILENLH